MKLIVGLGNPGAEYNFTRHNFGFLALDFFLKKRGIQWEKTEKFHAVWVKIGQNIFIKPQNFYNDVGEAVQQFSHFYKIAPEEILVICDDFNLPFGALRFRKSGSAGGNNGLKSIIKCLGTTDFPRLRLGTGNEDLRQKMGDTTFVLSKFTPEEKAGLVPILEQAEAEILKLIQ